MFVRTDVADEASCQEMVAATLRQFGRLDILVNNAAIFSTITMKPFWELGQAEWDELMAVNVRGVWLASKAVVPPMRQQRSGRIINILRRHLHGPPALLALHRLEGRRLRDDACDGPRARRLRITVNTITPGATYTEIPRETVTPEQREAMLRAQCIKRPESRGISSAPSSFWPRTMPPSSPGKRSPSTAD